MFVANLCVFMLIIQKVPAANILFVSPVASPSHHIWNEVLVGALLKRGHNITLIGHNDAKIQSKNYTVLKIEGIEETYEEMNMNDLIYNTNAPYEDILLLWDYIKAFAATDLESDALRKLLEYPKDTFDLIIFDIVCGQYLYPVIEFFGGPPVVAVSPFALPPYILDAMGTEFYSYFPVHVVMYTDDMDFYQRLENTALHLVDTYLRWKNMPLLFELAQKRFGRDIVPFEAVERKFQLLLSNYDAVMDFPVPLPPYIIPVGGLHTKRSRKLPEDLQRILDKATQGAIFFSFGTNVQPSSLSMEKKIMFLKAFAKLKETILWKYDGDDLNETPRNVIIRKWFPQDGILAHKNVKLFITHGGGLSTREAMYHGVPVIGMPLFMDQRNNVEKMAARMLGKKLLMADLNEDLLYKTIKEVLTTPIYKQNIQRISELFRDQKESPLERAVFWVEYVLRHKDLSHLFTKSRDMNLYQRQNIDIYGFVFVCLTIFMVILGVLIKLTLNYCLQRRSIKIKES